MSLTSARQDLMAHFENLGFVVYDYAPETIIPPAVLCYPSDPWWRPIVIGTNDRCMVALNVVVCVSMNNNQAALLNLEGGVADIAKALPSGYIVTEGGPVTKTQVGPSDLLTATFVVEVATTL